MNNMGKGRNEEIPPYIELQTAMSAKADSYQGSTIDELKKRAKDGDANADSALRMREKLGS